MSENFIIDQHGYIGGITLALISLINIGAIVRIILCLLHLSINSDDTQSIKKKIKNVLIFMIMSNTILGLSEMILGYFTKK